MQLPARDDIHEIMLSSTYVELREHRQAVRETMLGQRMFPLAMEDDAAIPELDLIGASLAKVDQAVAYVGLISYRFGQRPVDPVRNPEGLSLTELEFRRAVERGIPVCTFVMHGRHPVPSETVNAEWGTKQKLRAFIRLAKKDRIYAKFESVAERHLTSGG